MLVVTELHGSVRHGVWSAERGESRWAQNLAALLAASGHQVIGFGPLEGDGWGVCPRIPNLKLATYGEVRGLPCDVFFDAACWLGKPIVPNAKSVLLGYFSFGGGGPIHAKWPSNWHLAAPWEDTFKQMDMPENPQRNNMALLPYPLLTSSFWASYVPNAFPAVVNRVLWASKDPFGNGVRNNPLIVAWSNACLEVMEELLQGRNYLPTFVGVQSLDASYSTAAAEHHARARAEQIGPAFGFMPYGHMLRLMRESIITMNVPLFGSWYLEAALDGCCPLAWEGLPFLADAVRDLDLAIPIQPFNKERLRDVVSRLLSDNALRVEALSRYREVLEPYSAKSVLERWAQIERRWLR